MPLSTAQIDDRIASLVAKFIDRLQQDPPRKAISKSQLSALLTHLGGDGADGLIELVRHQIARDKRNREAAVKEGRNHYLGEDEQFWRLLDAMLKNELAELVTEAVGEVEKSDAIAGFGTSSEAVRNEIISSFALRLAAALVYFPPIGKKK